MKLRSFTLTVLALGAAVSHADDGILYTYGSPRLMHGESSIRMVREFVRAEVFRDHAQVRCSFVFKNDGPALGARIGFPDGSDHLMEDGVKPEPCLENFRSHVDGSPVLTKAELSRTEGGEPIFYHVKTVHFSRGQTRVIEDSYRVGLSGGATSSLVRTGKKAQEEVYVSQLTYIMQSGGSWKGNIGEATLVVVFEEKRLAHLKAVSESKVGDPIQSRTLAIKPAGRVIWRAFAAPSVIGHRLRFHRKNFKPTATDDVRLTFDCLPHPDSAWGKR